MAVTLSLSILEQNDSKALVFTDTTTWGTPAISDIPATYSLFLDLTIQTIESTVVYDPINLYTQFGPFTSPAVFTITPNLLKKNGVSQFNTDDLIPDGIINVTYRLVAVSGTTDNTSTSYAIFTYNQIKTKVYAKLRNIYPIYTAYDSRSKEISDALLQYSFIKSMEASAYVALESELLNILDATNKIYINGSTYTWQ